MPSSLFSNNYKTVFALFIGLLFFSSTTLSAQCACDVTIDVSLPNQQFPNTTVGTVCLIGQGNFPQNGRKPGKVCIPVGANITIGNNMNFNDPNWDIDVYGTLNINNSMAPMHSTITVRNGGLLTQGGNSLTANGGQYTTFRIENNATALFSANDFGNLIHILNDGTVEFRSNSLIYFKGGITNHNVMFTTAGNNNAALKIQPGKSDPILENTGSINVAHFENHTTINNGNFINSGSINVRGTFYNHGRMLTTTQGSINMTCEIPNVQPFGSHIEANSFYVGDKVAGTFVNRGVYNICGNAKINGMTTFDGGTIIVEGNIEINKPMNGVSGTLIVNGTASATPEGYFGNPDGNDMIFYSPSGVGINGDPANDGSRYIIYNTNPLPVILSDFQAKALETSNLLSWNTTVEINAYAFDIEKSLDGITWDSIGTVKANNTLTPNYYKFSDKNPLSAKTTYYRLKMIDLDNSSQYSAIRSISSKKTAAELFIYPNPATNYIQVNDPNWNHASQVFIYDGMGKVVMTVSPSAGNETIDITALKSGLYHMRIIYKDGQKSTHSFQTSK